MRSFGMRRWGNAPDGATEILTGTYNAEGEVSRRLLDALPPRLVLRRDEWETPVLGLLAAEMLRDEVGQDAVLDRLLDLLLIDAVRTYFARTEQTAPGWYRAQRDPVVGAGRAAAAGKPGRGLDHRRAGGPDPGVPGHPGPALRRGRRPAADGVPHRVAADPGRRPHPRPAGDRRLGRPRRRLQLPVRAERRVQAGPRRQPARAPRRPAAARHHRRGDRHDLRRRPRPGGPGRVRDRPPGGLQRRRARGDHHDHGPGAEGAGRRRMERPARPAAGAAVLHPQLHLRRDLLEQPPPPAPRRPPGDRRGDVVQPAPAVLAVAHPGADRVGRRAPHEHRPGRDLRGGRLRLGGGLHDPGPGDHPRRRQLLAGRDRDRQRHQGPYLAAGVRGRDRAGVRVPVDLLRPVRRGGADVVHPRPPPVSAARRRHRR